MKGEGFVEPEVFEEATGLPLSPLALRILEVSHNEPASRQSLADAIATDTLLAPRLLQLASYAPDVTGRIGNVREVINSLGVNSVQFLALGLSSFPYEDESGGNHGAEENGPLTWGQLWQHSLACAIVAGRLAARAGLGNCQEIFAAGWLHDIGQVLLYRHWPSRFFEALAVAREKNIPAAEAETLAVGRNHLEIGALWAEAADLPPLMRTAIGQHHLSVDTIELHSDAGSRAIAVLQLADWVCEAEELGQDCDSVPASALIRNHLGLHSKDRIEAMKFAKQAIASSGEVFGFSQEKNKTFSRVRAITKRANAPSVPKVEAAAGASRGRVIPFPLKSAGGAAQSDKLGSQKLNILIVEDHGSLCDMLSLYLMRYGYHVRTANDGESALAILDQETVHLVLLDLMLPRIDGFTVLHEIRDRQEDKHPYVIVVSAGASTKDRARVLEMGANEYMPKPFHLTRLLERIQNVEKYLLS
jgi:CheY-like chemotaxis protein/HD-like signal output (HDOD) protein